MKDSVKIWKSGNSNVVIISPVIMEELGLSTGDNIEIDIRRPKKNGGS